MKTVVPAGASRPRGCRIWVTLSEKGDVMPMRSDAITEAVTLTKAALEASASAAGWIDQPDTVARFLEAVARKLEELKTRA